MGIVYAQSPMAYIGRTWVGPWGVLYATWGPLDSLNAAHVLMLVDEQQASEADSEPLPPSLEV